MIIQYMVFHQVHLVQALMMIDFFKEKKDILKLIDQAYKMIPSTMKAIHFNIPENRNMFIPNVNRPLVKVFNEYLLGINLLAKNWAE